MILPTELLISRSRLRIFDEQDATLGKAVRTSQIVKLFTDAITGILVMAGADYAKVESIDAEACGVIRSGEFLDVTVQLTKAKQNLWLFDCEARIVLEFVSNSPRMKRVVEPQPVAVGIATVRPNHRLPGSMDGYNVLHFPITRKLR